MSPRFTTLRDDDVDPGPSGRDGQGECLHLALWTRPDESVTIFYGFDEQPGAEVTRVWLE